MSSPPPLLGALGAAWKLGAPVVAAIWDADGTKAGYALGDGHLAVADANWPRGPRVSPRPSGGVELTPAEAPAPEPVHALCHQGSCLALAAGAHGGFLTGGDDGRVVLVPQVGQPAVVAGPAPDWVNAIACHANGWHASGSGRHVQCWRGDQSVGFDLPAPATALAFSPDGACLAAAHSGGVTLWTPDGAPRLLTCKGYHRALAWSPDARHLVSGMQENALHGWRIADGAEFDMPGHPGQPLSLSFAHDGRCVASSGDMRPVCWGMDIPPRASARRECGPPSHTPVVCVACHPRLSLVAAGYFNGAVLLCQPGSDAVLFVKGAGGGAVQALAWSPEGSRLAFGTQDGLAGWLELPPALFRTTTEDSRSKETMA